jgi:thioredoxin 1
MNALPKTFEELIQTHDKPILVDFWAEWCPPCKMLGPELDKLAKEWKDQITIIKVNTDEKQNLANQYQISGIPTLILFKNGKEIKRSSGAMPLAGMKSTFGSFL